MKYWLILLFAPAVLACVVPEDGMKIENSMNFCSDVYYLDQGISVSGNNITINCDGAVFKSWSGGTGISIEDSSNITISSCRIVSYNVGFLVRNSTNVFLNDNHLVKNQIGTRFVTVSSSATFNHDVSLLAPFKIFNSENNVISLTNKFVSGDFCSNNFCNERRNSISLFVKPKTTIGQLQSWLADQLTGKKARAQFHEWVFGNLF